MEKGLLIKYGEIAIKGNNRCQFENVLIMNIAAAVRGVGFAAVSMMIITLIIGNWFVRFR